MERNAIANEEAKLDWEVEEEWKQLHEPKAGRIEVSMNQRAQQICKGLRINFMNMRCEETGKVLWQTDEWSEDVFRIEQEGKLTRHNMNQWRFTFGFVIPGSTNTWQQSIESAGRGNMLDPSTISGKLMIETAFYNGELPIARTIYRIYYI
ncbi:unnamed protein product [Albugo candida]|uniref:GMP phosphodiesterase delta subunit domain-containing protein n=1 Tax=Albugo candida TaxID=65357 RepID=A0A024GKW9_9STRA|nr:unnamed protein product [Albugo candida]|eukprot:CCI47388.1 unnamed protein product [Albugo candida]